MNCKACRIEIEESDETRPLSRSAGAHLEACAACRAFQKEQAALRCMIGSLEVVAAPADFDFRLRARLAAIKSEGARQSAGPRFAPGARAMALAASFVLLIAVGLVIKQGWLSQTSNGRLQEIARARQLEDNSSSFALRAVPNSVVAPENISLTANANALKPTTTQRRINPDYRRVESTQPVTSSSTGTQEILNSDSASTGATNLFPPGISDPSSQSGMMIAVPIQASRKSATLTLNFGGAKPQNVSLRPVTFGAQNLFEQGDAAQKLIPSVQGIW